jgi:ABC-type transport system involved in multi-copper enzyme maturation permease subunit
MRKWSTPLTLVLIRDTFHEAFLRWVFWGLFGLSSAMILFFLFLMRIDLVEGARATISLFGQSTGKAVEVAKLVREVHAGVSAFFYMFAMFLAVFASATLMPAALERGRVELLLSKPLRRWHLLLARYGANLLVVTLNTCYLIGGVWLIFGWKAGVWHASFLYAILATTFMFAVLLTVVALVAVSSESAALATMITFALMVMSPILAQHKLMAKLLASEWSRNVWKGFYHALPKFFDVGGINMDLVMGRAVVSWTPVWTSAAFAVVVLSASVYLFQRRDY